MIEKEYLAGRVASANDAQLVAIVYEGLIDYLNESIDNIKKSDNQGLNASINKCREILAELIATMSGDSEISMNYKSIYMYVNELITKAHISRDTEKLEEAVKVVTPLYEGWRELGEKLFKESVATGAASQAVSGITYGNGYLNDQFAGSVNNWEKG